MRASTDLVTPSLRQTAAFLLIGLELLNVARVLVGLGPAVLLPAISKKQKAPPFDRQGFYLKSKSGFETNSGLTFLFNYSLQRIGVGAWAVRHPLPVLAQVREAAPIGS